jgi:FlaA1/EpsC-like NDP-sugar epimerase
MLDNIRNRYLLASDALLLAGSPFIAYALRFEGFVWSNDDALTAFAYAALSVPLKLSICFAYGNYGRLWRHASIPDVAKLIEAALAATAVCAVVGVVALPGLGLTAARVPNSVLMLDFFFTLTALASPRLLVRVLDSRPHGQPSGNGRRALIVGAGAAGEMILKELIANPQLGLTPVGFVDDDPAKLNHRLNDLPVFGPLSDVRQIIDRHSIGEVIIAIPTAPGTAVRNVVRAAIDAKVPARTVPGLFDILSGRVAVSHLRRVEIQDLLRREPIQTDLASVRAMVSGATVLVTGAGGSIGSELARQLAALGPSQLVLFGNGENEIFDIHEELKERHPTLPLAPIVGDVRDRLRVRTVFQRFRPRGVFHAAAHKHVPLMEENTVEAITNNVLGTRNVVAAATEWRTEHFVFISSDKAVRPTSVMGATKRVAEMVVQDAARRHRRNFVCVRFGNVLGSRCSVVPIFLRQIQAGGPITITHPEMRRFFMTIPEAVQLVLQAGVLGEGGEVFALDMGEPVKITDLAADLIRLSGLEPGRDIEIRYTGIRPGERLYEEGFFGSEDVLPTAHPKILRALANHLDEELGVAIDTLVHAARVGDPDEELRRLLRSLVPEYREPRELAGRNPAKPEPAGPVAAPAGSRAGDD